MIKGVRGGERWDPQCTVPEKHLQRFYWWTLSPEPARGLGVGEKVPVGLKRAQVSMAPWVARRTGPWSPTVAAV